MESISSSVNKMSYTAKSVSENSAQASNYASKANNEAQTGMSVVEDTITSINSLASNVDGSAKVIFDLHQDCQNIGTVLEVIKSIAEQTNLLALNAAIEAARAGDLGRGFAVVADEVRTLAQKTQTSTHEIENMIDKLQSTASEVSESIQDTQKITQTTVDKASIAGNSLHSIVEAVEKINEMNQLIDTSASEQFDVTQELLSNVETIKKLTEDTADASEFTATSAGELNNSNQELKNVISLFKV